MGNICDGLLHLQIPLPEPMPFPAQEPELFIEPFGQPAHGFIPAGNGDQIVGLMGKAVGKLLSDLPGRLLKQPDFDQQHENDEYQNNTDKPKSRHSHPASRFYLLSLLI